MIKGEGLSVIEEKLKALDLEQREIYKFLGCEQAEKIDMERVMARVKVETQKRMNALVQQDLYDKNLIKAINRTVIPVSGYVMNVCTFTKQKLDELDKAIKKIRRDNKMHGRQASDEQLYMRRENGGRGSEKYERSVRRNKGESCLLYDALGKCLNKDSLEKGIPERRQIYQE